MTTKKRAGKRNVFDQPRAVAVQEPTNGDRVRRGAGEFVRLNLKLTKASWLRLSHFAKSKGETMQSVVVDALSAHLAEDRQGPLE